MSLVLTPLDLASLPPGVQKVVAPDAPAALQQMVARGMAPLPPRELLLALYQLAQPWLADGDAAAVPTLVQDARKTVGELPDGLLLGVLAGDLDGRIIHFVAHRVTARTPLLQAILFNKATADDTFASLARVCGEAELTIIARNEERLLRHPPIIAALYMNRKTPMSIATRAVELAIRNHIAVEGIPCFGELKAALESGGGQKAATGAEDAAFRRAAEEEGAAIDELIADADQVLAIIAPSDGSPPIAEALIADPVIKEAKEKVKNIGALSVPGKIRLATLGNAFVRSILVRDSNRMVALAAVSSPQVGDNEVVRYANNRGLSEDVIRYIARQKHFLRLYQVKLNLVNNPKTPTATAITFLGGLSIKDLRNVARSKSIPSALVKTAQGIVAAKQK